MEGKLLAKALKGENYMQMSDVMDVMEMHLAI
jgi:hypothetical protein